MMKKEGAKFAADQICSDTILRSRKNRRRNQKNRDWKKNREKKKKHFIYLFVYSTEFQKYIYIGKEINQPLYSKVTANKKETTVQELIISNITT